MNELIQKVLNYNKEIKTALETIYAELNKGQQQKLLSSETVKALFDRYGVKYK